MNTPGGSTRPAIISCGSAKKKRSWGRALATVRFSELPSLHVARLRGRHGAQDHRRQIADVHAHLEGGRAGQQVRIPGLAVFSLGLELELETLAIVARQQSAVLGAEHALDVAAGVELSVIVRARRFDGIQAAALESKALGAVP